MESDRDAFQWGTITKGILTLKHMVKQSFRCTHVTQSCMKQITDTQKKIKNKKTK